MTARTESGLSDAIHRQFQNPKIAPQKARLVTHGGVHQVARLAYPVILTQLSYTLMGVVDSAMVGQLGATPLAAVGLGGAWVWTLFYGLGVIGPQP